MREFRVLRVETAMTIFRCNEVPIACLALKCLDSAPYFPIDVLPRYVLLPHELNEPVHVPVPVCYMVSYDRPMKVYENFSLGTYHPVSLITCKQLTAIETPI